MKGAESLYQVSDDAASESSFPAAAQDRARTETFEVQVRGATWEADGVLALQLVGVHGQPLPPWSPGAHIDLTLPSGLVRQYSLCGAPGSGNEYLIAILLEPDGRGGSQEIHTTNMVGRTLVVRGPRNQFPLVPYKRYLFVAGGIGVTPLLAMARAVSSSGAPWSFFYGGRSRSSMAFVEDLLRLPGGSVTVVPQDVQGLLDVRHILAGADLETGVYACGPEPMLRAVEDVCAELFPAGTLHVERFLAGNAGAESSGEATQEAGTTATFEVELRRSGVVLTVPVGQSILDAVRDVVPEAPASCEQGFCGSCETAVLEGTPEHRDTVLTEAERKDSRTMMICVGRAKSPRLVLDL